jgi:hypothetical protein
MSVIKHPRLQNTKKIEEILQIKQLSPHKKAKNTKDQCIQSNTRIPALDDSLICSPSENLNLNIKKEYRRLQSVRPKVAGLLGRRQIVEILHRFLCFGKLNDLKNAPPQENPEKNK